MKPPVPSPKIELYTAVDRPRIKAAISLLASMPLVYVEQVPAMAHQNRWSNAYRLVGLDTYKHAGTVRRAEDNPANYAQ